MFTGIVTTTAPIVAIEERDQLRTLVVALEDRERENLEIGASVANNGVCLTVTKLEDNKVFFDVMEETLRLTNLEFVEVGSRVNIERSLVFGKEVGGHVVSGHVHTRATLTELSKTDTNCRMRLTLDPRWMKYILHKGFVAVNGCSLTVGEVFEDGFALYLIPETLSITNLGEAVVGTVFNIEIDSQTQTIVDTVERVLAARGQ
ncbi:riboflavin synthase subunit alpha [Ferrimonas balearica]|uniref:riboflavin synthase subunit alpha n=1 Tax=Ferrimonas balearica TaxID=44012 RepID=UPI001C5A2ED5|nr:riboflavin synthase subunit alpha [Ferrimonas balearica]MBW3138954.1 riboflavin synthase subunit alpha [Ferrimonas balearica]MBW3163454.1 riboflavin synthase subunit alpha [Ferrimonas balearica]MBY5979737.1 riboflavin synthase subunit alpha [Ferrimonas balearica]MBY6106016.1 riboflavin synthase subunit alpha [Ferrimonas balearica]MBY6223403.1 riboflavin synthase subunit alpha [Ferrimonas balearica]